MLLATGLFAACAGSPEENARPVDVLGPEAARASIEQYLEASQPLDHTNTAEASHLAQHGEALLPALLELLAEERPPGEVFHLIRLGCAMVHDGRIDAAQSQTVRRAAESASARMRPDSHEARLSALELARCHAPEPGGAGESAPDVSDESAPSAL